MTGRPIVRIAIRPMPSQARWVDRAACTGQDPDLFFPVDQAATYTEARAICAGCTVRQECLDWALAANELEGLWGGFSPVERYTLKLRRHWAERGHADLTGVLYLVALVLFIAVMLRILGVRW